MNPEDLEPDRLYFSITEVAEFLQVNISTLRYWEKEFSELKPRKNKKGDRMYNHAMVSLLRRIKFLLKDKGYTIEGARLVVKNKDSNQIVIYNQIERLNEIRQFLMDLRKKL